jgi:lantibiotic modifying enzyme
VDPKVTHFRIPEWCIAGVRSSPGVLVPIENVPLPLDDSARPQDFVGEMVDGFRQTYQFFMQHREQLIAEIQPAASQQVRYLFRETVEYHEALNRGLNTKPESAITLAALPASHAVFSMLRQDETAALEQLDIPRFTLPASSRGFSGMQTCFHRSGFELVLLGIQQLCDHDLDKQVQHIRLSWGLSRISNSLS